MSGTAVVRGAGTRSKAVDAGRGRPATQLQDRRKHPSLQWDDYQANCGPFFEGRHLDRRKVENSCTQFLYQLHQNYRLATSCRNET